MTISSREKEVPTKLPAARLYLDDIEEIRDVIVEAAASRLIPPDVGDCQHQVETKFYIGDRVCTEIQDLPKIKKRTRDFEMQLSAREGFYARFGVSSDASRWTTNGLEKADAWSAFRKLETIFERRRVRWKPLPTPYGSTLIIWTLLVTFFLALGGSQIIFKPSQMGLSLMIFLTLAILSSVLTISLAPRSEVILRYSWNQAMQREDRNTKILIGAVSALIAFLLGIASMALKHKYWP